MAERLTRMVVVERAADLADGIGLDDVTITKLGRALGVAPPGLYRHVADLADLRRAIGNQAAREVAAELSAACTGRARGGALRALATTLRRWGAEHPGRYTALQIAPDPADVTSQRAAGDVLTVFAAALRGYELTGDDLTDAIRLVRSTLHGFIALEATGGFKQPRDLDETFARIVDSLDLALASWAR